ncbi:hypothetical protein HAX54_009178 [Datura stramonium]|uniref:Uncharacterized protein n=1 Tax=Datura stramonium TaxID=4076 RepID=A0ABS8TG23_DATST|nr:hypothetical protein [Datura stramonium]
MGSPVDGGEVLWVVSTGGGDWMVSRRSRRKGNGVVVVFSGDGGRRGNDGVWFDGVRLWRFDGFPARRGGGEEGAPREKQREVGWRLKFAGGGDRRKTRGSAAGRRWRLSALMEFDGRCEGKKKGKREIWWRGGAVVVAGEDEGEKEKRWCGGHLFGRMGNEGEKFRFWG